MLEEGDAGDAGCPGFQAKLLIGRGDSAQGQYGDLNSGGGAAEGIDA
jgi:hypothetical protein